MMHRRFQAVIRFSPINPMSPAEHDDNRFDSAQVLALFDALPETSFFVKDRQSRFIQANRTFLRLHGCRDSAELVGKCDFDFHPPALAAEYVAEDRRVIDSGQPVRDQAWLVPHHSGMPRWYLGTKIPLVGDRGTVIGLAGILRPIDQPGYAPHDYQRLTPALEHALKQCRKTVSVPAMAKRAGLSTSQLQREFRRLFRMSPSEYVMRLRLQLARRQLTESNDAVGTIAQACGFYDQSHFTRAFKKYTGLTPLAYRRQAWQIEPAATAATS
jgi:PAS domain S-box-containing protein